MAASEQDSQVNQANASQASMASNPAPEGEAVYPTPDDNGPAVDNPAVPAKDEQVQQQQPKRSSLKDKAKAGLASFQNKLKGIGGSNANNNESKEEKEQGQQKKDGSRLSMEGLLKQARISFEKWVDVERPNNYPMPHGIVFLTSIKGSFGWGAEAGTGIVLYRLSNDENNNKNNNNNDKNSDNKEESSNNDKSNDKMNDDEGVVNENKENKENNNDKKIEKKQDGVRWSGPCAIGSGGVSFGLQIGVSKVDHIIMLPRRHHVRTFTSKGQLKLGGSSELTVVNVGGKAQGSVNIGAKEMSDIHSYSLDTKGLSIGVSVEGAVISTRGDCNNTFYGKNVSVEDIAHGTAIIPQNSQNEDYNRIVQLLNKHFKIYKPAPMHPHHGPHAGPHAGPHVPHPHHPHHPHGPPPPVEAAAPVIVGAALGVVGALARGPRGGGFRGGFRGGPR